VKGASDILSVELEQIGQALQRITHVDISL